MGTSKTLTVVGIWLCFVLLFLGCGSQKEIRSPSPSLSRFAWFLDDVDKQSPPQLIKPLRSADSG